MIRELVHRIYNPLLNLLFNGRLVSELITISDISDP